MTGYVTIGGMTFYFADSKWSNYTTAKKGMRLTGWNKVNNLRCYFMDDRSADYVAADKGRVIEGLRTVSGAKYYFGSKGESKTGWQTINGSKYYFADSEVKGFKDSDLGKMLKGFKYIGGKKYYFNSDGKLKRTGGAADINGKMYYIGDDGVIVTKTGWLQVGSTYYYVKDSEGILATGWLYLGSATYYLDKSTAKMAKGLKSVNGTLYFFSVNGQLASTKGWKSFEGNDHYTYTYSDGRVAVNTEIDGYRIGSDGRATLLDPGRIMDNKANGLYSNTNYLILVNKSTHRIGVYKGSQYNWTRKTYEPCSTGSSSTPTIEGTFTTSSGAQSDSSSSYTHWYLTDFGQGCSIWSVPCYKGTKTVANSTLGVNNDNLGCIRVSLDTAEWLWDAIPNGTKIVVYE